MDEKDTNKSVFSIKSLLGVFLIFIAVAGFLGASRGVADNPIAVILTYIFTFPSLYLGGIAGYWAGTLFLIVLGFVIALFKNKLKPGSTFLTLLGLFLIYLAVLMIASIVVESQFLNTTSSGFDTYNVNTCIKFYNELMFDPNGVWNTRSTYSLMVSLKLGGGFIGFGLTGLLATVHPVLMYVVVVLLILGGIFLTFRKTIIAIFKKDNKAKPADISEENQENNENKAVKDEGARLFIEHHEDTGLEDARQIEAMNAKEEKIDYDNIPHYEIEQEVDYPEVEEEEPFDYFKANEKRIEEEKAEKEFEYNLKSFNRIHGLSKATIGDIDNIGEDDLIESTKGLNNEKEQVEPLIEEVKEESVEVSFDDEPLIRDVNVFEEDEEREEQDNFEDILFDKEDVASELNNEAPIKAEVVIEEDEVKEEEPKKPEIIIPDHYDYPPTTLLTPPAQDIEDILEINSEKCADKIEKINRLFARQGIDAYVEDYTIGPCITRFNVNYGEKGLTKHVKAVEKDISRILGGYPVRFVDTVLGMETSGLEVANESRLTVSFKECFEQLPPVNEKNKTMICLGKDINNNFINANISKGPHMLVSGTTGSGKSVFMNSIITTLIMRNSPKDLRLIMVDPKQVEMAAYEDLPHLLCPIINNPFKAKSALEKLVKEMDMRYAQLKEKHVTKIEAYNALAEAEGFEKMPTIVCLIDEFADLADNCKDVSKPVSMLGQKSRAAGIHIVLATQRPTTNIVNGTIKSNLPFRVALSVKTYTDSSVILDEGGAENLLGNGDMLVSCPEIVNNALLRCQGSYLSDKERDLVVDYIKAQWPTNYDDFYMNLEGEPKDSNEMFDQAVSMATMAAPTNQNILLSKEDALELDNNLLYNKIKEVAMGRDYISKSFVQNTFKVGFTRACSMISRLAEEGIVSKIPEPGAKGFRVLMHGGYVPSENEGSSELVTETYIDDDDEEE